MEALAVDWSFALPLLFTVLAVLLASAFVKLRSSGAEKEKEEKEKEKEGEEEAHADAASGEVGEPREAEARTVPPAAAVAEVDPLGGGEGIPEEKKGEEGERRISVPVENLGAEEKEEEEEAAAGEEGETRERGKEEAERTAREEPQPSTTPSRPAQAQAQREEEEAAKPLAKEAVAGVAAGEGEGASVAGAASLAVEGEQQEDEEDDDDDEEEDDEEESKEEDQESENEKLVVKEPETEDADEQFFKYSPGKLRGSQYKAMMTKEELEDEQRVKREQLTAIFSLLKEKPDTFGEMSETDMKDQLRLYDI
ncbi:matrix-remodeling-associated protein 7 isoform X1 [Anolis sagrei]|uniref:matrix-remodeling-associated protein 7 isoform X1 n=1 Tax=Anolis sagrei TaxID=38937 RepID=UPI00351FE9D0